jgi:hypothetical protein
MIYHAHGMITPTPKMIPHMLRMISHIPGMILVATRPQEKKLKIAHGKRLKKS